MVREHLVQLLSLLRAALLAGLLVPAAVGAAERAPSRWQAEFDAFSAADRHTPPQVGGVVFVGSSSIRMWDGLETQFERLAVLKRGFGGSTLRDCSDNVERLVIAYAPRTVVIYAGENDLAEGATPDAVLESLRTLTGRLRVALPDAHIAYVSIKPSPLRLELLPQIRATNSAIRGYLAGVGNAQFIDVYSLMIDTGGTPRPELFRDDRLHLNSLGYALWKRELSARLPD
jgi:lysophospholipase L1-like esterase